jgi:very-short-patch-repair endonuclease
MKEVEIVKLYQSGKYSTYQIAERYDTYPNKIRRILVKHGVEMKSRSQAQKAALANGRATHPTEGSVRTKEERLKISSTVKKYWSNMSDEEYEGRCSAAKDRWFSMSEEERQRITSLAIEAVRKAGKEGSKMEKFLLEELNTLGYDTQFHKKNLIPNEKLEIDLYIPALKTIIEIDGPSHFLPIWGEEKLQKQIKADDQKTGLVLSKGFVVLRVKNMLNFVSLASKEKLVNDVSACLKSIESKFPVRSKRFIEIEL